MNSPPKVFLAHLPTPLERLERMSQVLGVDLWVKRDDQTGLALGGNKTRKLEYLVADALEQGADTLVTAGAPQSNHCRQTAAAAARHGLRAVVVLGGPGCRDPTGNYLLDQLLGARLVHTEASLRDERMAEVADEIRAAGGVPYVIPVGGSNALGAIAYRNAVHELARQMREIALPPFDVIVMATSSGGTHAGLAVGVAEQSWDTRVLGISVDEPHESLTHTVAGLANACSERLGLSVTLSPDDIDVCCDYMKPGYAVMTAIEQEAITTFARVEGLLLDPVYTGRAGAGLLDLIRQTRIARGARVLFWHTGGAPALFAYDYDGL